jgi:Tat protein translocase TatC
MATPAGDQPMSIGAHLGELRKLIIVPAIVFGLCFIAAFICLDWLTMLYAWPLGRALQLVNQWSPADAARVGMPGDVDPWNMEHMRVFTVLGIEETAWNAVHICFVAATVVTIPVLLRGIWRFVAVGLTERERALGFLLLPMGVIFFYAGVVFGFTVGVPYIMAYFINFTVTNPTVLNFGVRLTEYQSTFMTYTIVAGLLLDIPWLIMVLARTGLVSVAAMSGYRKIALLITAILAAIIAPPGAVEMVTLMVPIYGLFEIGLLFGRLVEWDARRLAAKQARIEDDVGTD